MAAIEPIIVTLGVGGQTVSRVGFGNPLIVGFTGSRSILKSGLGEAQTIYKSVIRQDTLSVEITNGAVFAYVLNGDIVEIEVPVDTIVRDLVADFNANAGGPVIARLSLKAGGLGLGKVVLLAVTPLVALTGRQLIVDISQLDNFYDTTDPEFKMFVDQFASAPSPQNKYLLDVFGLTDVQVTDAIQAVDDGAWYAVLVTSIIAAEQQNISEYIITRKRIALFVSSDVADAANVKSQRIIYVIHDAPNDHPENAWAAFVLPTNPGSVTWAFQGPLAGQTPNATSDLAALLAVQAANAQSYVELNNLKYMDEGLTTDDQFKTFIDQIRSRDWIELNLEADLLSLLVNVPNGKIPYTNAGIDQVTQVVKDRLELAGNAGIIRPIESAKDAELSSSKFFFYKVSAPSRKEIADANPADIANRVLNGVEFSFEESGAIHGITANGKVIIPT